MRYLRAYQVVVVQARVYGPNGFKRLLAAVDTAAARTLVPLRVLELLGYDVTVEPTATIVGVTGRIQVPLVRVERVQAIGATKQSLMVVASDLPRGAQFDALLGVDFLRNSRLTIDFRRGEIELEA